MARSRFQQKVNLLCKLSVSEGCYIWRVTVSLPMARIYFFFSIFFFHFMFIFLSVNTFFSNVFFPECHGIMRKERISEVPLSQNKVYFCSVHLST